MSYPPDEERLTKTERREAARAERKALEEKERADTARRKRLTQAGVALGVLVVLAVVAVIATSGGGGSSSVTGSGAAATGLQTTRAPWGPSRGLEARMTALNLPVQNNGGYHVHAALRIYVNGGQVPVAAEIGHEEGRLVSSLGHTHDTSGVIHIETSERYPFTLGQFFTVWGVKFTSTQLGSYLAGNGKVLSVYVNGQPVSNPVGYVMNPHDTIVVGYGKPGSFPTSFKYNFQGI